MESNTAAEATTPDQQQTEQPVAATVTEGSDKKQQREPRSGKSRPRKAKNGNAVGANTDDGAAAQADQEPHENDGKRQQRGRRGARGETGDQPARVTRDLRNVFGEAILDADQIRDTVIEQAESTFCAPEALHEKLKGNSHFARLVRVHERVCEINDTYGVMDFSLKAKSRHSKDIDNAYYSARNDLSVWNNVRDGNTLLLEYNPEEDNRLQNVTFLR